MKPYLRPNIISECRNIIIFVALCENERFFDSDKVIFGLFYSMHKVPLIVEVSQDNIAGEKYLDSKEGAGGGLIKIYTDQCVCKWCCKQRSSFYSSSKEVFGSSTSKNNV